MYSGMDGAQRKMPMSSHNYADWANTAPVNN
jgi:hypothetical protein